MLKTNQKTTSYDPIVVCMLSGGMDSALVLYKLLTEHQYSGYNIHAHHIRLINREKREQAENIAVENIIKYLADNDIGEPKLTYSAIDISFFCQYSSHTVPDIHIVAFIAGNLYFADSRIKYVTSGRTKEDTQHGADTRRKKGIDILNVCASRPMQYLSPIQDLTKKQIWASLPAGLRKVVWWCRTPVYTDNKIKMCGQCFTCRQMKPMCSSRTFMRTTK